MASSCNPCFLIPGLSLQLLLTMTWHSAVTENIVWLRGEVGGTVAFHCPVDNKKTLTMLYLQKGNLFVNGYYASKNVSNTWENTRVDLEIMTIFMHELNVSHSGDYQCIIQYNGGKVSVPTNLHLDVTANFSKPSVSVQCSDQNPPFSCLVQCTSHGGYPGSEATWHIPGSSKVVNNSKMRDPVTETFNISSTANINCSHENLTSFSCSVGNVSSDMFSVCTKDPLDTQNPYVMAAAILAVVFIIVMALVWWCSCKKGQRRAAAEAGRPVNGFEEEVIVLNETEAS